MENLFDHTTKVHIRLTPTKTGWKKETSTDKKIWTVDKYDLTLDEVMLIKSEVINNNFKNLNSIITKP